MKDNELVDAISSAIDKLPYCDDPSCRCNTHGKTCHIHKLAVEAVVIKAISRVLENATLVSHKVGVFVEIKNDLGQEDK